MHCSPISGSATYTTGIPIAALDISPRRTHAILAGRDILKTIEVSGSYCREGVDLRSAVVASATALKTSAGDLSAKNRDQWAVSDVKWSHDDYDSTIATAAANGQIVLYDINQAGYEIARLHEHNRQVHRVAFSPFKGGLLLSGSQDATVRLWDLRDLGGDRTCRSVNLFLGNNEGVRDLRWSPTNGVEFATATDNGVIQRWDIRKPKAPLLKLNAHEKTCNSIDWHPDGKYLLSGGADKNIKIWDFSSTDRRMKARWQLRAPKAVQSVRWRPPSFSSDPNESKRIECTQFAASYDHKDPRIHIWDFRRPCIPFREITRYESSATDMLWHSEGLLWTVGLTGTFTQNDVNYAPKVITQRSTNVIASAPNGQLMLFSNQRSRRRSILEDATRDFVRMSSDQRTGSSPNHSGSRSATDGSLEDTSLLSSSFTNRHRGAFRTKPQRSFESDRRAVVSKFDESMHDAQVTMSAQVATFGYILGVFDAGAFQYLACLYQKPSSLTITNMKNDQSHTVRLVFERNARVAALAGQYQLAQSWRVLGVVLENISKKEADRDGDSTEQSRIRGSPGASSKPAVPRIRGSLVRSNGHGSELIAPDTGKGKMLAGHTASQMNESSSNMTTPLARPVADVSTKHDAVKSLPALEEAEALRLPASPWEKRPQSQLETFGHRPPKVSGLQSLLAEAGSGENTASKAVNTAEAEENRNSSPMQGSFVAGFGDVDQRMTEQRAAMQNYRARPRPILQFDESGPTKTRQLVPPPLDRHDSNESFQMFSASTESSHLPNSLKGSLDSSQGSDSLGSAPVKGHTLDRSSYDSIFDPGEGTVPSEAQLLTTGDAVSPSPSHQSAATFQKRSDSPILPFHGYTFPQRPSKYYPPVIHIEDMKSLETTMSNDGKTLHGEAGDFFADLLSEAENAADTGPWTAAKMLPRIIQYYTADLSSPQFPAHLFYHLESSFSRLVPAELVHSILLTYHSQLVSLALYIPATELRNVAGKAYPDVAEHGMYGIVSGGPWCTNCRKYCKGDRHYYCERCRQPWGACPICDGEGPAATLHTMDLGGKQSPELMNNSKSDILWGWCQECGHGGHVGCLRVWFSDPVISEGGCATSGCLHDCNPGKRRDETMQRMDEGKKTGSVKGDEWVVGESPAVGMARGMVDKGTAGKSITPSRNQGKTKGLAGPRGGLSLGSGGRSGSGSKKVKLMTPAEQKDGEVGGTGGEDDTTSASAP